MFLITDSMLSNILRFDLNHTSEYVSCTNNSQLQHILRHPLISSNPDYKNKLQSIILFSYKTKFIELIQSLWKIYRQSGMDELNIDPEIQILDRHIWPKEIQLLMNELYPFIFGTRTFAFNPFSIHYPRNVHTYSMLIESCYHVLQQKHDEFQTMLTTEIHHLPNYKARFKEQIDTFIKERFLPLQIAIDCQIELIYYEYKDELYRRQLASEILNDEHMTLLEQLCQQKSEQENIKSQINLYQYMYSNVRSENFLKSNPFINCTRNPNLQNELDHQYGIFQEKLKSNTFHSYLESLEIRHEHAQLTLIQTTKRFWQRHQTLINQQQQNLITIQNAIDQRLSTITNRMTCIEKYKKRFLQI